MESTPPPLRRFLDRSPEYDVSEGEPRPLAGDVSSRRYFRGAEGIILTLYPEPFSEGWAPIADASSTRAYFATRLAEDGDAPLTWANDPVAQIESTNTLLSAGLPVPELLAVDGPRGVIAVADVGDITLQSRMEGATQRQWARWYREAVDLICLLQGPGTEVARGRQSIPSLLALDGPKLAWEMAFFDRNVLAGRVSEALRIEGARSLGRLCGWLGTQAMALCHRDYHCRNLMISQASLGPGHEAPTEERLVIIDHQDARMGPRAYDMVSLLDDPYLQPDPGLCGELWSYFIGLRRGVESDWEAEILGTRAQRLIKAAGTYGAQVAKGRPEFEAYLKPTLEKATQALEDLGSYGGAVDCLRGALAHL